MKHWNFFSLIWQNFILKEKKIMCRIETSSFFHLFIILVGRIHLFVFFSCRFSSVLTKQIEICCLFIYLKYILQRIHMEFNLTLKQKQTIK